MEDFEGEVICERGAGDSLRGVGHGELKIDVDLIEPVLGIGKVENVGGEVFVDNIVCYVQVAKCYLIEGVFLDVPPAGEFLSGKGRQLLKGFDIGGIAVMGHVGEDGSQFGGSSGSSAQSVGRKAEKGMLKTEGMHWRSPEKLKRKSAESSQVVFINGEYVEGTWARAAQPVI